MRYVVITVKHQATAQGHARVRVGGRLVLVIAVAEEVPLY
jgi:hypothetical protein